MVSWEDQDSFLLPAFQFYICLVGLLAFRSLITLSTFRMKCMQSLLPMLSLPLSLSIRTKTT